MCLQVAVISTKCFEIEAGIPYYGLGRLILEAAGQVTTPSLQTLGELMRGELATIFPMLSSRLQPR